MQLLAMYTTTHSVYGGSVSLDVNHYSKSNLVLKTVLPEVKAQKASFSILNRSLNHLAMTMQLPAMDSTTHRARGGAIFFGSQSLQYTLLNFENATNGSESDEGVILYP